MLHTPTSQPLFIRHKSAAELLEKQAAAVARMPDDDKRWPAQVLSEMHKQLPFLSRFDVDIEMTRIEPEAGYALGYAMLRNKTGKQRAAEELGKPTNKIRVPVIVADRLLQPFHVFEVGGKTYPLTQERLESAMMNPSMFDGISDPPGTQSLLDQIYPPFQHRQGYGMMSGDRATTGVSKISSAPSVTKTASGESGPLREFLRRAEIEKEASIINLVSNAAGKGIGAALRSGTLVKGSEEFLKATAAARAAKAANPRMLASRGQVRSGAVKAVAPIPPGGPNLKVKGAVRGPAAAPAAAPVQAPPAPFSATPTPTTSLSQPPPPVAPQRPVPALGPAPRPDPIVARESAAAAAAADKPPIVARHDEMVPYYPPGHELHGVRVERLPKPGAPGASVEPPVGGSPVQRAETAPAPVAPTSVATETMPITQRLEERLAAQGTGTPAAAARRAPLENLDGPLPREFPVQPAAGGAGSAAPPPVGEAEPRFVRQAVSPNRSTQVRESVPLKPAQDLTPIESHDANFDHFRNMSDETVRGIAGSAGINNNWLNSYASKNRLSPGHALHRLQSDFLVAQQTNPKMTFEGFMGAQQARGGLFGGKYSPTGTPAGGGFLGSAVGGATMLGVGALGGGMMMANKASENY